DGKPTATTRDNPDEWGAIQPLLTGLEAVFAEICPAEYAVVRAAAARLPPGLLPPGTALTTWAINRWTSGHNARMAFHPDANNLEGGYAVMTVLGEGDYSGGGLVLPRFFQVVYLPPGGAVLIMDNHELHGNTEIVADGWFQRFSVVGFFHNSNKPKGDGR